MNIPDEAVSAAATAIFRYNKSLNRNSAPFVTSSDRAQAILALVAAAPHMLSHEREETRLAHLDAVVNAESLSKYEDAIQHVRDLADNAERDRDYVKVVDAAAIHWAINDALGE